MTFKLDQTYPKQHQTIMWGKKWDFHHQVRSLRKKMFTFAQSLEETEFNLTTTELNLGVALKEKRKERKKL